MKIIECPLFINAFFIKIFSYSIYGTYFLVSLCHGSIFLIFGMIIRKFFNEKIAVSSMTMLFLIYPAADMPWPDFLFMSLILISFYILIIAKRNYQLLLSGFLYSVAGLTKDNLTILLFLSIFFLYASILYLICIRKKIVHNNFTNIYWIIGYIIPLAIFFLYLNYNSVLFEYFNHFNVGKAAINHFCSSEIDSFLLRNFDCGWIALRILFENSITKIFTEPYWLFFLLIIAANLFFIINTIFFILE